MDTNDGGSGESKEVATTGAPSTTVAVATPALSIAHPTGGLQRLGALFKTDAVKEETGTWMPVAEGVEIQVRSQQSDTARNISKRLLQRFRAALAVGASLSAAQNAEFEIALCSEALVTDWKGLTDDDNQLMACTPQNIRMLVTELPHLRRQILAYADSLENYR